MELFDKTFNAIGKKLDLHLRRHAVLSSNVANSETPNFRARELDFAGEMKRVLQMENSEVQKTSSMHMDIGGNEGSHIVLDNTAAVGADGNNVDLDLSMGKMNANARAYTEAATLIEMKLRLLRMAAQGRGA